MFVLAVARLSRELGENSPPHPPHPPRPTQTVLFSKIGFLIAGVSLIPSIIPSPPPPLVPILSVLHKELEYKVEKLKNKKFEGHAAKDQSQIRTTTW